MILTSRVVLPWERMVDVCQRYGVLSLVDGAHSIGQRKVDVGKSKCDFFVTVSHFPVPIRFESVLTLIRTVINGSTRKSPFLTRLISDHDPQRSCMFP
jgi:hypothetical protein